MAKKKTNTVPVDGEKLKRVVFDHNYTLTEISVDMGFAGSYLSRFTSSFETNMPKRTAQLLEVLGIHYEDYKPDEDEPLPWDISESEERLLAAPSTVILSSESITELCNAMHGIIYDAVYNAVDKAMREVLL